MDLTPFTGSEDEEAETCDLRTNPLQEGRDVGRRPSSSPSSDLTTRSMERTIQEDWDSATDGRETFLYMFKNAINLV